jgi:hypothetical protein
VVGSGSDPTCTALVSKSISSKLNAVTSLSAHRRPPA